MLKGFDRHEILTHHYYLKASGWNWEKVAREAREDACRLLDDPEEVAHARQFHEDGIVGRCCLGTVFSLMPSGKYYTFWTTNQTHADEIKDAAAWEALEKVAHQHGLFIGEGEGCPSDLFACVLVPLPISEQPRRINE